MRLTSIPGLPQGFGAGHDVQMSAQVGDFPPLPAMSSAGTFRFDSRACSPSLHVAAPNCLRCLANATRARQGVCFLEPALPRGEQGQLRIRLDNKPGRMRYFLGVARKKFDTDAPDTCLRELGWSIENLYAAPHREKAPCRSKATPIFHTGSVVTVNVDLRESSSPPHIDFSVDSTGFQTSAPLPARGLESVVFWVSLYNRFAQFTILDN